MMCLVRDQVSEKTRDIRFKALDPAVAVERPRDQLAHGLIAGPQRLDRIVRCEVVALEFRNLLDVLGPEYIVFTKSALGSVMTR